jgi:RNA polymerase sigma-70 factor (ECF subfamily)
LPEVSVISESELVSQYRTHVRPLYAYVSRRTGGNRPLSEDVVQETWLRALRDWRRNGLPREPLAWLSKVASNLLASHFRAQKPAPSVDVTQLLDGETPQAATREAAAMLHLALEKLRPREVRLIEAFHFDGKTLAEIAHELGISERAAEGRVRRAREALKARLVASNRSQPNGVASR